MSTVHATEERLESTQVDGEPMFVIRDVDRIPPFLMSIVSDADHWMFVSSAGGLTAGRGHAERCLFPYETDDRLHIGGPHTGPFTTMRVRHDGAETRWNPFAGLTGPGIRRHLYKSPFGNRVLFEEIHEALGLSFRYGWSTSLRYGLVRDASLLAERDGLDIRIVDGIRNVVPDGVPLAVQQRMSNLVNAYKRSERIAGTRLAIYSLESLLSDRARPAEALRASVVWSEGLDGARVLLGAERVEDQLHDALPEAPSLRTGRPGDYLLGAELRPRAGRRERWRLVADVGRTQAQVVELRNALRREGTLARAVDEDVARGTAALLAHVGRTDGRQRSSDPIADAHHFANVLFNDMRGGIFTEQAGISGRDFAAHVRRRNRPVAEAWAATLDALPEVCDRATLARAVSGSADLRRLAHEYLPLSFSRRHGDPSRPWNRFHIRTHDAHGELRIAYEGNWRDIFQNWEALCASFPDHLEDVIAKFVNASTIDGFNPYRLSDEGVDWEVPEPDEPWSNIGYWGDHQVVYLLRLLEASRRYHPDWLPRALHEEIFSYADVPYRIADYDALIADPKHTIRFDEALDAEIAERAATMGSDARLLLDERGRVRHVGLLEKLLVVALSKLSSFVSGGGVWMNTQRPEWNDANNALPGWGLSMVTLFHLRRYLDFLLELLDASPAEGARLSASVAEWLGRVRTTLEDAEPLLAEPSLAGSDRRALMDALGRAFSDFRHTVYRDGPGPKRECSVDEARRLARSALRHVDHTIASARRSDGLYHGYTLLRLDAETGGAAIEPLYEMLEGQVAALSAGRLGADEALALIDALFESRLFRPDQGSFMLYPNRRLPGFLDKNQIPRVELERAPLLQALLDAGDASIVVVDAEGCARFAAELSDSEALERGLDALAAQGDWSTAVARDRAAVVSVYETVFDHRAFTGRSGSMYAYEGLGSIYWHMVAKLLLAVQETHAAAEASGAAPEIRSRLAAAYHRVRSGLGFCKTPALYGAFPTDPYSNTPAHAGAQQPGMTGQVKEEILTRLGELGVRVEGGRLGFSPSLLRASEFLPTGDRWRVTTVRGESLEIELTPGSLAFTVCQIPIVYHAVDGPAAIRWTRSDGESQCVEGCTLDAELSAQIFSRSGTLRRVDVDVPVTRLLTDPTFSPSA